MKSIKINFTNKFTRLHLKRILMIFGIILLTSLAYTQQPSGIDPDANQTSDEGMNLVWKILIFGGIPVLLLVFYLIFKNKQ